ncbi:MAG: PKD domain-containing protein [Ginsengibacter sp.]
MRKAFFCFFSILCTLFSFGQSITPAGTSNICEGGSIVLAVDPGLGSPTTYQWLLDSIPIKGANKFNYTASLPGNYSVILDQGMNTEELLLYVTVIVNKIPVANFTSDFASGSCGNEPVNFKDKSTDAVIYSWDFGDPQSLGNNTSTDPNPTHRFVGTGGIGTENFTITLTVSSAEGNCKDVKKMTITAKQSPDANLGGTGYRLFQNLPGFTSCGNQTSDNFTFTNLSSTKATNKSYRIIWGDGTPDFISPTFAVDKSHKYLAGNYTLEFIIDGENGCTIKTDYNVFIGNNPIISLGGPPDDAVCAGTPLKFTIGQTENNPLGTRYVISFGDGSKPMVYSQTTVPPDILHTFLKTSCGVTSGIYKNAYEAIIIASNPCKVQEAVVRPIYVSEKPKPSIGLSPGKYVCPNTTVKLSNNTIGNGVENGTCSSGIPVWTITPSTGWTLVSGTFGNDNGSNTVSKWIPGDNKLQLVFTEVGTYKVRMRVGSTQCGVDEDNIEICVNPPPTASFTTNVAEGCGPLIVRTSTKTNKPLCGENTYQWTVDYTPPVNCGEFSSLYEYANGSSEISAQPVFKLINPGVYTIGVIVSSSNGQCSTQKIFKTITVKGNPAAELSGVNATICGNGSIIPIIDVRCFEDAGTTFLWSFPGGNPVTSDKKSPGTITYKTQGNFIVSVAVTNACGVSNFTAPLAVNPIPLIGTISSKSPDRCDQDNGSIKLSGLAKNTSFSTYFLFNGIADTVLIVSNASGEVILSGLGAGIYSDIFVETGGCKSVLAGPVTLVKPPLAIPDFDLDPTNACGPVKVRFTNNTANLTSFQYKWDFGTGKDSSNLSKPADVTFYPGTAGQDTTYIVKLTAGVPTCEVTTIEKSVTVRSRPIPFFSPDKSTGCSPFIVTFTNVSKGLTTKYYWDFGDGTKLETDKADMQQHTFTTTIDRVYPVQLIAENSCGKDTFKLDIQVAPNSINLNIALNGPDHIGCVPHTVTVYNNSAGGSSFNWDFGDGTTQSTTKNQDSVKHTYLKEGKYTITLNGVNSCSQKSTTDYVEVFPSPTAAFIADKYKSCTNQEITFTNQSISATSYKWDFGDNTTSDQNEPSHAYATPGFYRVILTANRVNGPTSTCSETTEKIIEVTAPSVAIVGDDNNCTNVPLVFVSNVSSKDQITETVWELSNGATGSGQNFEYSFVEAGDYTLKLTATNSIGCSGSTTQQIKIDPQPVLKTSADVVICQGKSTTLNVSGASSYQWSPSLSLNCTDCASPVASPQISTPYLVRGTNSFKCTATETVLVTVIEPFTLSTSLNDSICEGQSVTLRVSGTDKYIWAPAQSLDDNLSANPIANPKITTTYLVTGYDSYSCFSSTAQVKVSVGEKPTIDLGPDRIEAAGTVIPLTVKTNGVPIKSYLWSPSDNLDCADCPNPNATIKKNISYSLLVTSAFGCEATDIINIKSICENTQVFIPNTFTPDGDGLNDILMIRGRGIARVKSFRIFNRLGEIVFEKTDFPANEPSYGWDGRVRGIVGEPAVYVYTAEVICENGLSFIYKGNITILK